MNNVAHKVPKSISRNTFLDTPVNLFNCSKSWRSKDPQRYPLYQSLSLKPRHLLWTNLDVNLNVLPTVLEELTSLENTPTTTKALFSPWSVDHVSCHAFVTKFVDNTIL